MARIKNKENVKYILTVIPETRNDDHILYYHYIKHFYGDVSFEKAFVNHKTLNIPPYHSIGRCRRELQREFPELQANESTREARIEEQMEYEDYYRRNKNVCR